MSVPLPNDDFHLQTNSVLKWDCIILAEVIVKLLSAVTDSTSKSLNLGKLRESVTMEAYDLLPGSPSTQAMKNNQKLKDATEGVGLKSRERQVCRIAFEGYLGIWMKIATTNPELLKGNQYSDEFISCRDRCAVRSNGSQTDHLVPAHRNIPVHKLPKKQTKAKHTRVERMRRLYMQCKAPDPLAPQTPGAALGPNEQEHWEREMDELLEWTHSLSFKELDELLYAHI